MPRESHFRCALPPAAAPLSAPIAFIYEESCWVLHKRYDFDTFLIGFLQILLQSRQGKDAGEKLTDKLC